MVEQSQIERHKIDFIFYHQNKAIKGDTFVF